MDAFDAKENFCTICRADMRSSIEDHVETDRHKYNTLVKHSLNNPEENKQNNRSGVGLRVESLYRGRSKMSYFENCGKYVLDVFDVTKFGLLFEFMCIIANRTRKVIKITHGSVLDGPAFMYDVKDNSWLESDTRVCIYPGSWYCKIRIAIDVKEAIYGKYAIPFGFNIESGGKNIFITRTIIVSINGSDGWTFRLNHRNRIPINPTTKSCEWVSSSIVKPTKERSCYTKYRIDDKLVEYLKLTENKGNEAEYSDEMRQIREMMEGGPTLENYQQFFKNCLWAEEESMPYGMKFLTLEKISARANEHGLLVFPMPNLSGRKADLAAGNLIRVRLHKEAEIFEGYILGKRCGFLEIHQLNRRFLDSLGDSNKLVDVQFLVGRIPMERNHKALERVVEKQYVPNLFPNRLKYEEYVKIYDVRTEDFFNGRIADNPEQKTAVLNILNGSSQGAPYIVFGPPGTGKTDTIVEAICQILEKTDKRILVCAQANAHCDMLAIKLSKYCQPDEMVRAYSSNRHVLSIPEPVRKYANLSGRYIKKISASRLQRYRIVISTLIFIGNFNDEMYTPDYVFIDEAAQATEPEVCVAFSRMKKGGTLVLAGDPKQLKPLVISSKAQKFGLETSLLQRLVETQEIYQSGDARFITTLKLSYRCHPAILRMSSDLFYDSKLTFEAGQQTADPISKINIFPHVRNSKGDESDSKDGSGEALEFCAVSSEERREGLSTSFFNLDEAFMIIRYITSLLKIRVLPEVAKADIGVITPYSKQVSKIKDMLKKCRFEDIEVGTIESFQGREKRIILMSTVRGQFDLLKFDDKYGLGFLKQPERFNVAITRAKSKLVVVGCPLVLNNDFYWRNYINTCLQVKTYFGIENATRNYSKVMEGLSKFPKLVEKLNNTDPSIRELEEDTESESFFSALDGESSNGENENEEVHVESVHDGEVEDVEVLDVEVQDDEVHNVEVQSEEVQNEEEKNEEVEDVKVQNVEVRETGLQNVNSQDVEGRETKVQNVEVHNVVVQDVEDQDVEVQETGVQNVRDQNVEVQNEDIYGGGTQNEGIQEGGMENEEDREGQIREIQIKNEEVHDEEVINEAIEIKEVCDEKIETEEVQDAEIAKEEVHDENIENEEADNEKNESEEVHEEKIESEEVHDKKIENEEVHAEKIESEEVHEENAENEEVHYGENVETSSSSSDEFPKSGNEDGEEGSTSSTSSSDGEAEKVCLDTSTTGSSSTSSEFEIIEIVSSDYEVVESDHLD